MSVISDAQNSLRREREEVERLRGSEAGLRNHVEALEAEFVNYKERAHAALAEKEKALVELRDGTRAEEEEIHQRIAEEHARAEQLAARLAERDVIEHNLKVRTRVEDRGGRNSLGRSDCSESSL